MLVAHTVLLITSGLSGKIPPDSLDRAIKQIVWLRKSPVLILGEDGDAIMQMCTQIESCEIVFDPNGGSAFSPVKAGLHATDTAAFVWQIDQPFPSNETWARLDEALRAGLSEDVVRSGSLYLVRNVKSLREWPSETPWPPAQVRELL